MTTMSDVPIAPIVDSIKAPAAKVNGILTPKVITDADRSSVGGEVPSSDPGRNVVATSDQAREELSIENDTEAVAPIESKSETEVSADVAAEMENQFSKVLSYHQNADMYIWIEPGITLLVCSGLVAASSPGFRDLVDSMKPSITRNGRPLLNLADFGSDSYGLDILLSIIH